MLRTTALIITIFFFFSSAFPVWAETEVEALQSLLGTATATWTKDQGWRVTFPKGKQYPAEAAHAVEALLNRGEGRVEKGKIRLNPKADIGQLKLADARLAFVLQGVARDLRQQNLEMAGRMAGVETRADNLEEWQKNVAPLLKGIGQPSWVAWTALAVAILALIAALWKRRSTVEPAEEQEEPARSPTRQQPAPPARPTPPSQGGPKPTLPARPGPAPAIPSPTPAAPPARPAPLPVPNTEPEEENDSAA